MKILKPFSFLYQTVIGKINQDFDQGQKEIIQVDVPVISLGNLTVGGTGKTPIVNYLLKKIVADGKNAAVISRSYRAEATDPVCVDLTNPKAARVYGDEPVLLASLNPKVDVYVGKSKSDVAKFAATQKKYDLFIVDDGFQHRRLQREMDLVILDSTESLANYQCLPEGRAREPLSSLQRADALILSKYNLSVRNVEKDLSLSNYGKPLFYFVTLISQFLEIQTKKAQGLDFVKGKRVLLISAIARPEIFENMCVELGSIVVDHLRFRDHHDYRSKDIQKINNSAKLAAADIILTTEKDGVKLQRYGNDFEKPVYLVQLEVGEQVKGGSLYEYILENIR